MVEVRATPIDSEDSTEWRSMTPEEIANHVKAANRKRRTTENSMTAGRSGVEADHDNVGYAEYHTACAEEEAIRTGAFLPTDNQKELAFSDAESLMSPPAHIQTQREDGCSSRASSSLTMVSRQHLGSRFSHSDAGGIAGIFKKSGHPRSKPLTRIRKHGLVDIVLYM